MFLVLIASNIYTEYDLSLIACPHHLLHQIYLPRTPSISTEAAAKDEAHTEKAQVSEWALLLNLFSFTDFLCLLGQTTY